MCTDLLLGGYASEAGCIGSFYWMHTAAWTSISACRGAFSGLDWPAKVMHRRDILGGLHRLPQAVCAGDRVGERCVLQPPRLSRLSLIRSPPATQAR